MQTSRLNWSWPHHRTPTFEEDVLVNPAAAEYVSSAEAVGLRYVTDAMPGIRRKRHGKGFTYTDPDGQVIRDRAMIRRFR